jgi:thymidylate kinase
MSFTDIPNNIIVDIINQINYDKLPNTKITNYNLIITGSVGVGKSTISQLIYEIMRKKYDNVKIYPEYIKQRYDGINIGETILNIKCNNIISVETFQHYILDDWNYKLKINEFNKNNSINIMERLPEDAINCFTKEAYDNKDLTTLAWNNINHKYNMMKYYHKFPSSEQCEFALITNNSSLVNTTQKIIDIISEDLNKNITNRLFGLVIDNDEYINRIYKRGRQSEINSDLQMFEHYNNYYTKLYERLK